MTQDMLALAILFGFTVALCIINMLHLVKVRDKVAEIDLKLHTFMITESKK